MGINGVGNSFNPSGVYGAENVRSSEGLKGAPVEGNQHGNMVVTEARARIAFAVATPELDGALNFTSFEREEYLNDVQNKAASSTLNLGNKSVMLDIYAVMELIRAMGQKLRNAMREMRQCENQAIQQNLKTQAAMQREAAWCQMIGGIVVGSLQAGASAAGTIIQIKGLNQQANLTKELGADVAAEQLDLAKLGGREDLASTQLNKIRKQAPAGIDTSKPLLETGKDVAAARGKIADLQKEIGSLQTQKGQLEEKLATGQVPEAEREACQQEIENLSAQSKGKGVELEKAVDAYHERVGTEPQQVKELKHQYRETIVADREALQKALGERDEVVKRHQQERAALDDSLEPLYDEDFYSKLDAKQAAELNEATQKVSSAREKLVQDYQTDTIIGQEYNETAKGQLELHESALKEVDGYKQKYQEALDRANSEKRVNGEVSAGTKVELKDAEYRYKLARAEQVAMSSSFDKLSPEKHQTIVGALTNELSDLTKQVSGGVKASGVEKSNAYGLLLQNLASAVGGIGQKVVDSITQIKQSHITEKQAEQKMLEEQLDQIKDLFAQDQTLIQKTIELFQSVISKESQSLEEIINALKA